jgi:hypothetical protein
VAVSLVRITAANQLEVAEAFALKPATLRRWDTEHADAGVAGLLPERKGPKRKSKLTGETVAAIRGLREGGTSYRAIAAVTGVSERSIRSALKPANANSRKHCTTTGSDDSLPQEQEQERLDRDGKPSSGGSSAGRGGGCATGWMRLCRRPDASARAGTGEGSCARDQ